MEIEKINGSARPSVGLYAEMISEVSEKIAVWAFDERDRELAENLALIISEIYVLRNGTEVKIAGEKMPVEYLRYIFSRLDHEKCAAVIENFKKCAYEIKNKKTYLRTALYNAVMESAFADENLFRSTT